MWGGEQAEPLKGCLEAEPQWGPGTPGQGVRLSEAERFLVLVHPQEWAN